MTDQEKIIKAVYECDASLFDRIETQTSRLDRRSLLALHAAARETWGRFTYLEIGSHLGGSLQALVADPACAKIISIDPRPNAFADERGIVSRYQGNSTARMLDGLKTVPCADLAKLETLELSTENIPPGRVADAPQFCLIDGEHTDEAALRDARFCLSVGTTDVCIAFHDANVVFHGIGQFLETLEKAGRPFRAYLLPDAVFVVELGEGKLRNHTAVQAALAESWKGYISGLEGNMWYRAVMNKPIFKFLRRIRFVRRIFIVKNFRSGQPI